MALTYAQIDDFKAAEPSAAATANDSDIAQALAQAEDDLDDQIFRSWRDPGLTSGRAVDVTTLDVNPVRYLMLATCSQAAYRLYMGDDFFTRPQYQSVSGPDFNTTGKVSYIGSRVRHWLRRGGLIPSGGRARPR